MDLETEVEKLRDSLKKSEQVQTELDRRVFYLKTLYDVSKDIFSSVDSATILRNFLLMAMGNFGVTEGFILLTNSNSKKVEDIVPVGLQDSDEVSLIQSGLQSTGLFPLIIRISTTVYYRIRLSGYPGPGAQAGW
jgi:hypothetical protein